MSRADAGVPSNGDPSTSGTDGSTDRTNASAVPAASGAGWAYGLASAGSAIHAPAGSDARANRSSAPCRGPAAGAVADRNADTDAPSVPPPASAGPAPKARASGPEGRVARR
jgi:hypothetical protein